MGNCMQVSKPKGEGWLGKYAHNTFENYQLKEYTKAIKSVKSKRTAIDLGANLGIMSYRMCNDFRHVHAFEPLFCDHLKENVKKDNITFYPYAVGEKEKTVTMRVGQYHSGGSNVVKTPSSKSEKYATEVRCVTVDSFDILDVDFIKIDVEDYEWYALLGCEKTIKKYNPTILMELKRDNTHYKSIRNFMKELGYSGEYVGELDCLFTQ